jgi:hypothetical protein
MVDVPTFYQETSVAWPVKVDGNEPFLCWTEKIYCTIIYANRIESKNLLNFFID